MLNLALVAGAGVFGIPSALGQDVVISEIYYHPPSGDAREEFIELHNRGTAVARLDGWRLSRGVRFTFPPVSIAPGGYLVVAADVNVFQATHTNVTGVVVGGWSGSLSRRGERIELEDADGNRADRVTYADEGDWADRRQTLDWLKYPTWDWLAEHDGLGKSLEVVDLARSNDTGQNWRSSLMAGGTPGRTNSVAAGTRAPFIEEVRHSPAIPSSSERVTVTAAINAVAGDQPTVILHHRVDGASEFATLPMRDDGVSGDGKADDGVFGTLLPARTNRSVVEFFVSATAPGGALRRWPADPTPTGTPRANALYQVNDAGLTGPQPFHLIVMTEADRAAYVERVGKQPGLFSNATTSATFISVQDGEAEVRYLADVRNRGQGSRYANVMNFRVDFPSDALWRGVEKINLNGYFPAPQVLGSALSQLAGFAMSESRLVQVRLNGANPAPPTPNRYGVYVHNEVPDGDYADRHQLGQANVYRALRDYSGVEPDLSYRGESPDAYRRDYFKETNQSEDDWTDLIALTRALDPKQTPDERYSEDVKRTVAVTNWMRYLAFDVFVMNRETAFGNGIGDDYVFYRDSGTGQFHLVPWDLDTIFNLGDTGAAPEVNLFQATRMAAMNRFLKWPEFAPLYYEQLLELSQTVFAPDRFAGVVRQVLQDVVPDPTIENTLGFAAGRRAFVLSQIPLALTVEHSLATKHGLLHAATNSIALRGRSHAVQTRAVRVNGVPAAWSAWEARWTAPAVALRPGLNRIIVEALDGQGTELERRSLDVWHESGPVLPAGAVIAQHAVWRPEDGPRRINGTLEISPAATLTIQGGSTVFLDDGARLIVRGQLAVEGQGTNRVRFSRVPGTGSRWRGIAFEQSSGQNRLAGVDFEYGDGGDAVVSVIGSRVVFDDVTWAAGTRPALRFEEASLRFERCRFGDTGASDVVAGDWIQAGGELVFRNCEWTALNGNGFGLRVAGVQRPGPVVELYGNRFAGTRCRAVRLIQADALLDDNVFTGVGSNAGDAIEVVGTPQSKAELWLTRNDFSGLVRAMHGRDAVAVTAHNNTFHALNDAVVGWSESVVGGAALASLSVINAVFGKVPRLIAADAVRAEVLATNVTWSLFSESPLLAGEGNLAAAARLVTIHDRLVPGEGSAAVGQGIYGWDLGSRVPVAPRIHAAVVSPTPSRRIAAWVWAPGATKFAASLDGGPYSPDQSVAEPIERSPLGNGSHTLAVQARDWLGRPIGDGEASVVRWRVEVDSPAVLLSEVKARNRSATGNPAEVGEYIEIANRGDVVADLSGFGLTDDLLTPYRFQFPAGTTLASGEQKSVSAADLGFSVNPDGEQVALFASTQLGGRLLDTVSFGPQVDSRSIARDTTGEWRLAIPTAGRPNVRSLLGSPAGLRINEWLTRGSSGAQEEFVELYNTDPLPVDLAGLALTDYPGTAPRRQVFAPLSFIPGNGWLALLPGRSDGAPRATLEFGLTSDQGMLGLISEDGRWLDAVWYPPQQRGVSWGRLPDGGTNLTSLARPLPGAPNGTPLPTNGVGTVELVAFDANWHYDPSGQPLPAGWPGTVFDDGPWPQGRGLFYAKAAPLPAPTNTLLQLGPMTFRFRTRFQWPASVPPTQVRFWTVLDDGAVVYLNGREVRRIGIDSNVVVQADTPANRAVIDALVEGPFELPAAEVVPGENVLAVEVHQATTYSSDVTFGLRVEAAGTNLPPADVRLNEVLADNRSAWLPDGYAGDWLELRNFSGYTADLSDMSLTDDPTVPRAFVFPPGTALAAGELLVLRCDSSAPASADNTGFSLDRDGDAVYLFARPGAGGLVDSVVFGFQAPDVSLGRSSFPPQPWRPSTPTPGSVNAVHLLNDLSEVRINEWMARPAQGEDWFELCNLGDTPVDLGGCHLTDDPANPTQHRIPDYSILGSGWLRHQILIANGSSSRADQVGFRLSANGERILLSDAYGQRVDEVAFGPQALGASQGRLPDGGTAFSVFAVTPSPGAENYVDTDADGMPDAWEAAWGLNSAVAEDAELDTDGDGASNRDEFTAGTNPKDRSQVLQLEAESNFGGTPRLRFVVQPGRRYAVEVAVPGEVLEWTTVITIPARGAPAVVLVPLTTGGSQSASLYRVRVD